MLNKLEANLKIAKTISEDEILCYKQNFSIAIKINDKTGSKSDISLVLVTTSTIGLLKGGIIFSYISPRYL